VFLNHLDLQVSDVQHSASFFECHLGFDQRSNKNSPAIAILVGESGVTLVLQRRKDQQPYPAGFHIGFIVDAVAKVLAFHKRARAAGLSISAVSVNGRGTQVYVQHDGITIEVSCHSRPSHE
jgi:catechol 2,3-dioxygenase-like lactoylglutathione lyase family enzyme